MAIKLHAGQKIVYQTDSSQMYVGEAAADPDPQNPGHWLIPAGCHELEPPKIVFGGKWPKWNGWKWQLVDKPQ